MWVTLKDDESALQAIKMGGYLCIYWASFYLFDLVNQKNYPIESHHLITFINFVIINLFISWFLSCFYDSVNFKNLEGYPILAIFGIIVNLILFGTFVWLGIGIFLKKRRDFIPLICFWTWFHLAITIFSLHILEWISGIILLILSVNAWRGWRFYQKREGY